MNRAAVREIADLYFERFDARLEQRMAGIRAEFRVELRQEAARLETGLANLRAELANQRTELVKWMFIFWAGTIIPLAGLILALNRL